MAPFAAPHENLVVVNGGSAGPFHSPEEEELFKDLSHAFKAEMGVVTNVVRTRSKTDQREIKRILGHLPSVQDAREKGATLGAQPIVEVVRPASAMSVAAARTAPAAAVAVMAAKTAKEEQPTAPPTSVQHLLERAGTVASSSRPAAARVQPERAQSARDGRRSKSHTVPRVPEVPQHRDAATAARIAGLRAKREKAAAKHGNLAQKAEGAPQPATARPGSAAAGKPAPARPGSRPASGCPGSKRAGAMIESARRAASARVAERPKTPPAAEEPPSAWPGIALDLAAPAAPAADEAGLEFRCYRVQDKRQRPPGSGDAASGADAAAAEERTRPVRPLSAGLRHMPWVTGSGGMVLPGSALDPSQQTAGARRREALQQHATERARERLARYGILPDGIEARDLLHKTYMRRGGTTYHAMTHPEELNRDLPPPDFDSEIRDVMKDTMKPEVIEEVCNARLIPFGKESKHIDKWELHTLHELCRAFQHYDEAARGPVSAAIRGMDNRQYGKDWARKPFERNPLWMFG